MPDSSIAERQWIVTVSGVAGNFDTKTGGEKQSTATREWDGGSENPEVLTSPPELTDLVVGRKYKPGRDGAFVKRCLDRVGRVRKTITVQPADEDFVPIGDAFTYQGVLIKVKMPDVTSSGSAASRYELTFAIDNDA